MNRKARYSRSKGGCSHGHWFTQPRVSSGKAEWAQPCPHSSQIPDEQRVRCLQHHLEALEVFLTSGTPRPVARSTAEARPVGVPSLVVVVSCNLTDAGQWTVGPP